MNGKISSTNRIWQEDMPWEYMSEGEGSRRWVSMDRASRRDIFGNLHVKGLYEQITTGRETLRMHK
jgi:hypothetical protein